MYNLKCQTVDKLPGSLPICLLSFLDAFHCFSPWPPDFCLKNHSRKVGHNIFCCRPKRLEVNPRSGRERREWRRISLAGNCIFMYFRLDRDFFYVPLLY